MNEEKIEKTELDLTILHFQDNLQLKNYFPSLCF